jgi:fructose-bisphosphate aldolase class I
VTDGVLEAVFGQLDALGVDPAGIVLKPNMVIEGTGAEASAPELVAERTLAVLSKRVPAEVPGIAFLSGGQSNARACANLTAINAAAAERTDIPWALTFSFGRALVNDALSTWHGDVSLVDAAQTALAENCGRASAASSAAEAENAQAANA